ncbi:antirestriction protein (plasmid) [Comamonas aquatica]|nr:antirestriction protein [Comamonas aquatica]
MNTSAPATSDTTQATIENTKVSDVQRMGFLPTYFGPHLMLHGEQAVYSWMRHIAPDYTGGLWEFYELSNGGFYMGIEHERFDVFVPGNGFEGNMSGDAAGIVATIFALDNIISQLYETFDVDYLVEHKYRLIDFSRSHPEAAMITAAID